MSAKKIMLLGEIGVGKTSLIRRLVLGKFEGTYKGTLGFDLYTFRVNEAGPNRDQTVPLVIWDTDGNVGINIFKNNIYMQGTSAALIVGDLSRPETWPTMLDLATGFQTNYPGRQMAFLLNKSDLAADTSDKTLPPRMLDMNVPLFRTSAKTGDNVIAAFTAAATAILRREA
jgi:small GTP-binding protein